MENENFIAVAGIIRNIEATSGVCGYDISTEYTVITLGVERSSGAEDTIIVAMQKDEADVGDCELMQPGNGMLATGILQKAVDYRNGRTAVFLLAGYIAPAEFPKYQNDVVITGEIVNKSALRETPRGKRIVDIMIKVENVISGGNTYIPCVVWQERADQIARYRKGTHVTVKGRLQSRVYIKREFEGTEEMTEERTTYEVSVGFLKIWRE